MPSVAEVFKGELLARVQAAPFTDYGAKAPELENIRRSHLTVVTRDRTPAIHLRFPKAKPTEDKRCDWQWSLDWTISIYVNSDNDADADPLLIAVLNRINPAVPYANNVVPRILDVTAETEIADTDAQRVDVNGTASLTTRGWSVEAMP